MFLRKIRNKVLILVVIIFIISSVTGVVFHSRYPLYYKGEIGRSSEKFDIDPFLVAALIDVESGFDKDAISPKEARGLMQITQQTGQWGFEELNMADYQDEKLFIPQVNIEVGTWYLQRLFQEFGGDRDLVLAAYNGGSGNVNKWLNDEEYSKDGKTLDKIPFKETKNYVKKVNAGYEKYQKLYEGVNFDSDKFDSAYLRYIYKLMGFLKKD